MYLEVMILQVEGLGRVGNYSEALALIDEVEKSMGYSNHATLENRASLANQKGIIQWHRGQVEVALATFQEALSLAEGLAAKNPELVARILNNIGLACQEKGDYNASLEYFNLCLAYQTQLANHHGIATVQNNIGNTMRRLGNLLEALENYKTALEAFERLNAKKSISMVYNNISLVYTGKGEIDLALESSLKSLALREELGLQKDLAVSYVNIGQIYHMIGDLEKAEDFYNQSLDLNQELGVGSGVLEALYYLTLSRVEVGDTERAKEYLIRMQEELRSTRGSKASQLYVRMAEGFIETKKNRASTLAKAQEIFESIVREPMMSSEVTTTATLWLCDTLLMELSKFGNPEILKELRNHVQALIDLSEVQKSVLRFVQAYQLKSRILLMEGDIREAEENLKHALRVAEEKSLWKLAVVLRKEIDTLKDQKNQLGNQLRTETDLVERITNFKLDKLMSRLLYGRETDFKQLMSYATDYIHVVLLKMGELGPEVVLAEDWLEDKDRQEEVLTKLGYFYVVTLGQGSDGHEGLYGPLPVPSLPDHIGMAYTFFIPDPTNADPRFKGKSYCILVFILPESLHTYFSNRSLLEDILNIELNSFNNLQAVTMEALEGLKFSMLGLKSN